MSFTHGYPSDMGYHGLRMSADEFLALGKRASWKRPLRAAPSRARPLPGFTLDLDPIRKIAAHS